MEPDNALADILADARARSSVHEPEQLARVGVAIGQPADVVALRLAEVVDRIEVRITRSLPICHHLHEEMAAGRVPTIRALFETGRQDHTEKPEEIAATVAFRQAYEPKLFGSQVGDLEEENRPKYGFAYFEKTPTEPFPFGPVCFILNLNSADLRSRITFTPVDSGINGLGGDEVGTLDHPFNAFARSSDAMRASGLLPVEGPLPPNSGLRDNAEEGVPEAQIWGPLPVTSENVQAIIVEVGSLDSPDLADLRAIAHHQGIRLIVRQVEGGF